MGLLLMTTMGVGCEQACGTERLTCGIELKHGLPSWCCRELSGVTRRVQSDPWESKGDPGETQEGKSGF